MHYVLDTNGVSEMIRNPAGRAPPSAPGQRLPLRGLNVENWLE